MKNLSLYIFLIAFLSACEEKTLFAPPTPYKIQKPKAGFTASKGENGNITINFTVNKGDAYVLDYGDGRIKKDTMAGTLKTLSATVYHAYEKNGPYKVSLTINNPKGQARTEQVLLIGNVLPPPVAGFSYELKDGGVLAFKNLSQNTSIYSWRVVRKGDPVGYNSKAENPTYLLENNGLYYVFLRATSKYGKYQEIKDSITISLAKNINNPTFEGTFFNRTGTLTGEGRNSFDEGYGWLMLTGAVCNSFLLKDVGNIFIVAGNGFNKSIEERYWDLKQKLVKGPVEKKRWSVLVRKEQPVWIFENGKNDAFNMDKDPDSIMEIIEVKEVDQPKITPEMYEKAFLVSFRIKVNLGQQGKIDGVLKMKYMFY